MNTSRSIIVRSYFADWVALWNRFWFTPADPATLGLLRILAGAMLFYTHLVWSIDLEAFFGPDAWVSAELFAAWQKERFVWSYLQLMPSTTLLWTVHIAGLVVFALLTIGLWTRVASILAYLIALAYVHRTPGALFGLDQMNTMLALYLAVGPSGAAFSIDRLLSRRRADRPLPTSEPSAGANVAIRLLQLHLCIVYLYSGISKLAGEPWWDGTALWGAVANYEYQSLDLTWMAQWPLLTALLTHVTVFWETFYCALVWPKLTRPVALGLAVMIHAGIGLGMGMITFGTIMIVANMAFLPPEMVRRVVTRQEFYAAAAERRLAKNQ